MVESSAHDDGKTTEVREPSRRTRPPLVSLSDSEILQRGLEAFSELGYQGASVRELAKRMKVSHNFINDRFESKEMFWRAAVDHALRDPLRQLFDAFESTTDDVEAFKTVVHVFYSLAANIPHMNRIMTAEAAFESERLDYLYSEYTGPFLERVEPLVERLMRSGRMPEMSMEVLFSALTGPAVVLTQKQLGRRIRQAGDPPVGEWDQLAQSLADVVIHGLLRN
ncbi:TetR family transcriptional regulator [Streptomyces fagopyri]|uniref:TetR family transcriptional regulator n=1 Tax=Streptomyces fagopyri TaxID=2662397 RepID=A0A5Q0L6T0_9ACTN|nr:TetR/AcrR family transcriptional regulator [Streptomyces fagopyri]QFZ72267.1 TetR family transcriptional regulator [Streptomyces fagopyri]